MLTYLPKNTSLSLFFYNNKKEIMKPKPNGTIDIHSNKPEAEWFVSHAFIYMW